MKVVISGFYGLGNTGDEAILEAIVDNLRDELPQPDITVFSLSPEKTSQTYNVNSIYRGWRHDFKGKVKALKEADLLISGGGGLLQDTYPTKLIFGPLPYYLLIVFMAKLCGTKVMFFSQGIGPVNSLWGKILMRVFANLADFITVRDQFSKDLLHKLGVNRPESKVTADIVFGFKKKEDNACLESLSLERNEKLVAVSVRPWFEHSFYYKELAQSLDQLIELEGITPVFVPMEGHHDVTASNKVMAEMKHKDKCHLLGPDFSPNQYLNFISNCEITIGLRLHSLIFSALVGIPHIGISYDKKVESLLKRTGMWSYSFPLEELDSEKLVENAQTVLTNRNELSEQVQEHASKMRKDAIENIDLLKKYFLK